ncbi:MAG: hypothetical protein AB7L90_21625 [Hyphomicrobiaceae bacterium]
MDRDQRIALAKSKVNRLVDVTLRLLRLRASNEILVYSGLIATQVPSSYAAHTFNEIQSVMFDHELIRLCTLWDSAEKEKRASDRDSIPAVIWLVDHPEVVESVVDETRQAHAARGTRVFNTPDDPDEQAVIEGMLAQHQNEFAEREAEKARQWLCEAMDLARQVQSGPLLRSVIDYRDRTAHLLAADVSRRNPDRIAKFGDEKQLLDITVEIVDKLHLAVNGASFDWEISRQFAARTAKAFWNGVKIKVIE